MAIKAVVDKLDDVEEAYRGLYVEKGGKFELAVEVAGVEGARTFTDYSKLGEALRKERNDHGAVRTQLKGILGERKAEDVAAMLERYPELEAAATASNGKVDESKLAQLVEAKLAGKLGPVQRELQTAQTKLGEATKTIEGFQARERTRTIHDSVRGAIGKAQGFQATAADDVLMLAGSVFEVDESGNVVTKDNVGVTPGISAEVWLTEMQPKRPHWWGATAGGGAGGNNGKGGAPAGDNPWKDGSVNVTRQSAIYREDPKKAEQLARSAGKTVSGGRIK